MTQPKTRVGFLLDESSSMAPHLKNTLTALGSYINALKEGDDLDIDFSLVTFSNIRTRTVIKSTPVKAVDVDVIAAAYQPNGSTPLIEACLKLIKGMEAVVQPDEKVIVVFQTDGQENCSGSEFTLADLQAQIKAKSDLGWQFVFLGAGLDAYQAAQSYGIPAGRVVSHGISGQSVGSTYDSLARNTRDFASGQAATMDWHECQKEDAGDIYAHQHPGVPLTPPPDSPVDLTQTVVQPQPTAPQPTPPMVDDISL